MGLSKYQKINHFPCAYEMTRKNCLGVHVWKMHERFSKDEFHFIPQTFSLPEQMTEFRVAFNKGKKEGTRDRVGLQAGWTSRLALVALHA